MRSLNLDLFFSFCILGYLAVPSPHKLCLDPPSGDKIVKQCPLSFPLPPFKLFSLRNITGSQKSILCLIVNNWYLFQWFCLLSVHLTDPHLHPQAVAQARINEHKHLTKPSGGCYLQHSISRIFTVCPIAVMSVQTVSELQPGFIKPKIPLTSLLTFLFVSTLFFFTFLILFCPSTAARVEIKTTTTAISQYCRKQKHVDVDLSASLFHPLAPLRCNDSSNVSRSGVLLWYWQHRCLKRWRRHPKNDASGIIVSVEVCVYS